MCVCLWFARLPLYFKLSGCQCVVTGEGKLQLSSMRSRHQLVRLSLVRIFPPQLFLPSNKSLFLSAVPVRRNLARTSEVQQQNCAESLDKEVHTYSHLLSKLTAHQEESCED